MSEHLINGQIKAREVRLVSETGSAVISISQAKNLAHDSGMDLVQFSDGDIPTVKIIDYSKFKFEQNKKKKEAAKTARSTRSEVKELQFRPVTDEHDIQRLINKANKHLSDGDRVKLVCKFRGRETMYRTTALERMNMIIENLNGVIDGKVANQNWSITAIVKCQ